METAKKTVGWTKYFWSVYQSIASLFPDWSRISKNSDLYSPLLSFQRLMTADHPLDKKQVVGFRHTIYVCQPIFSWSWVICLFGLNDRDPAFKRWSGWFGKTVSEGGGLIENYETFQKKIGKGANEYDLRERMSAIERYIVDPCEIWWAPINTLFCCQTESTLAKKYYKIHTLVHDAKGELPKQGMFVLKRLWVMGCEWQLRKAVEAQTECITPYGPLKEFLDLIDDASNQLQIPETLLPWLDRVRSISEKKTPLAVGLFHRYLRSVMANLGVTSCDDQLARLELRLWPHLKKLFGQVDPQHQMWVVKVKGDEPLVIDEQQLRYKECLQDNIHVFKEAKTSAERLLFFGANNDIELYLTYAKLQDKPPIHRLSDTFSFIEFQHVLRIDWKKGIPNGVDAALKLLVNTMPQHLNKTFCVNKQGMACWLPTENRVPLCTATIEAFLLKCSEKEASNWMKASGLFGKGMAQRSKVINALSDESIDLTDIENRALGRLEQAMEDHGFSAAELEEILIKEDRVLRLPKNLASYAARK